MGVLGGTGPSFLKMYSSCIENSTSASVCIELINYKVWWVYLLMECCFTNPYRIQVSPYVSLKEYTLKKKKKKACISSDFPILQERNFICSLSSGSSGMGERSKERSVLLSLCGRPTAVFILPRPQGEQPLCSCTDWRWPGCPQPIRGAFIFG